MEQMKQIYDKINNSDFDSIDLVISDNRIRKVVRNYNSNPSVKGTIIQNRLVAEIRDEVDSGFQRFADFGEFDDIKSFDEFLKIFVSVNEILDDILDSLTDVLISREEMKYDNLDEQVENSIFTKKYYKLIFC